MDGGLASIFFVLVVSTTAVQSQITKGPANALKKVGDNITLECVTNSNNCDDVEWKKMEGAQSPRTVYTSGIILNGFKERYSVNRTGGCSLTITQLKISDSGRFSCVLTVDSGQDTRSSILVVINVTESCRSNVTNNELSQNDSYSFRTAINVPAKSVEPSNVTLSFPNKTADETETTDDKQPPTTVKTTLTGIARKENITQRVCWASLPPITAADFDRSIATLEVCTTQHLVVSYLAENIAVSPPAGPYHKGATIRCIADGHPSPTFKWTHLRSGQVVYGDTLVINGEAGDKYNCTATNIIKGKPTSHSRTIEVFSPPPPSEPGCGPGCCAVIVIVIIIIILVVIWLVGWKREWWPLWFCFPCFLKKDGRPIDITGLCCKCCTCFSISFCAICEYCTYFACCVDNKDRAKEDGKSAAQPVNEVVSGEAAETVITNSTATVSEKPVTNSTATVLEKPLTEVVVSSDAAKPLTNSTTVSEKPVTNSTATVLEKPLTEVVVSSEAAEPLTNSTTTVSEKPVTNSTATVSEKPVTNSTATVLEKPLTEVAESSEAAEPLTNSTAPGPQKPPRVSYSAPTDSILTSQTEAGTSESSNA